MNLIAFCKFHGFGNDYIVIERKNIDAATPVSDLARAICHRQIGAGSDGVALLEKLDGDDADYFCEIVNPDGSIAGFSGNGTRSAAAYLHYTGLWTDETLRLQTHSGIKTYRLTGTESPGHYTFDAEVGKPRFASEEVPVALSSPREQVIDEPIAAAGGQYTFSAVNVGNPVAAIFMDGFDLDWRQIGREVESHSMFPERTNVVFVAVRDRENIDVRIWERGAGETAASGTCSAGAAVLSAFQQKTGREVNVHSPGGTTRVLWRDDDEIVLTGRADLVYCGEWLDPRTEKLSLSDKTHITGLKRAEIESFVKGLGEPRYRATQIFKAVHQRRLRSFDEITDLPKEFRAKLAENSDISRLTVESRYVSTDGTRRYLMKTADGKPVETVYIPTENRDTICFSSQSGCPLMCDFCLTAKLGLLKNLTAGEIVEQIIIVLNDVYGVGAATPHGTNLVGMGAGEPFLNFENLITALRVMADEDGLFIVPNRVTVSTAGIVPKIYELANLEDRPHLAISLAAPTDELRDRLMPINKRWNIDELMKAAREFEKSLRRGERFTFEYVMLGGVNDTNRHAGELASVLRRYKLQRVKVNLIPHNGAEQLDYSTSTPERVSSFKKVLEDLGVSAYVRTPRGRDIYAACGQLAAKAA